MAEFVISSCNGEIYCAIEHVTPRKRETLSTERARLPLTEQQAVHRTMAQLKEEFSKEIEQVRALL